MDSRALQPAVDTVLRYFPDTEALYLFGSHEKEEGRPGSDIDIAVLLPAHLAADADAVLTFDLQPELSDALHKPVDCVNLRRVSVVFRKEIIFTGQRFFTGNTDAAEEFEMLTLSYYQKLNDERKAILEELFRTKRSYAL
jgi:predicted nucleotidyltransferase